MIGLKRSLIAVTAVDIGIKATQNIKSNGLVLEEAVTIIKINKKPLGMTPHCSFYFSPAVVVPYVSGRIVGKAF